MKRNLKRIISIILVGILSIGVLPQTGTQAAEQTPGNYVIQLVIDGLSNELFDELKASGAQTPNIDWLMEQGDPCDGCEYHNAGSGRFSGGGHDGSQLRCKQLSIQLLSPG